MSNQVGRNIFHELIKKIANNSLQLASLPDIIVKVNAVLDDDTKGLPEIVKVIQNEIALSTRIIQIANSPALRGDKEITSISDAINRLGIDLIKNLAICVSLKDKFDTKNMTHKGLMEEEMRVSNRRSIYGFMIAKHLVKGLHPEISLISGLVSKIGQVVIIRYIDEHPTYKFLNVDEVKNCIDTFGDELGDLILRKWSFPADIIDAVYGRAIGNLTEPTSYRDVYVLTETYLGHFSSIKSTIQIYNQVNEIIETNKDDLHSLEQILN